MLYKSQRMFEVEGMVSCLKKYWRGPQNYLKMFGVVLLEALIPSIVLMCILRFVGELEWSAIALVIAGFFLFSFAIDWQWTKYNLLREDCLALSDVLIGAGVLIQTWIPVPDKPDLLKDLMLLVLRQRYYEYYLVAKEVSEKEKEEKVRAVLQQINYTLKVFRRFDLVVHSEIVQIDRDAQEAIRQDFKPV